MKKLLFSLSLVTLFFACDEHQNDQSEKQIKIVCTTGMLGDAVTQLVDTMAEVHSLMGPGVDPHLYKATQGDLKLLSRADIIIYNGLHLEGKMGEIFEKLRKQKKIIAAADAIDAGQLINSTDFQGAHDPHLWFDVALWSKVVNGLSVALLETSKFDNEAVANNHKKYTDQLMELDQWTKAQIAQLNDSQRVLITAHDAFGYFGKAYNIEVKGLQGISTLSEYGLKDVSDLVDFISQRKIKSVFVESSVSDRSLKAVVEGCLAKGHEVKIGGTLYSDAMGETGSGQDHYIGMVRYNVTTIVEGLK